MSKKITLQVKDASSMDAYIAMPDAAEKQYPAVIVLQEAFGVNGHIKNVADRIAKEGYVAIAPELFHRTAPAGFEADYKDFPSVQLHMQAIAIEGLQNDLQATYDWLQDQENVLKDKIASIGFCLGGRVSFVANSYLPLSAAISFYGGGIQNILNLTERIKAPHLFFWGGKDQHIKAEHTKAVADAFRSAGKDFINVEISYADHGFFCDERSSYNPEAASEAWAMTKAFLKNKLQ